MTDELAKAWSDGYQAGVMDEERCTHRADTRWWRRLVWFLSRGRVHVRWPWEKCYLYATDNPYDLHEEEDDD